MKPRNETIQPVDEFEPIELGSVSEETKGGEDLPFEIDSTGVNSMPA